MQAAVLSWENVGRTTIEFIPEKMKEKHDLASISDTAIPSRLLVKTKVFDC